MELVTSLKIISSSPWKNACYKSRWPLIWYQPWPKLYSEVRMKFLWSNARNFRFNYSRAFPCRTYFHSSTGVTIKTNARAKITVCLINDVIFWQTREAWFANRAPPPRRWFHPDDSHTRELSATTAVTPEWLSPKTEGSGASGPFKTRLPCPERVSLPIAAGGVRCASQVYL